MGAEEDKGGAQRIGRVRVLVIDDDPAFREFAEVALDEARIEHDEAESAERGLARLREMPAGTYDLVLLDVEMPGASGWEFLEALRASGDEVPVIFVSGRDRAEDKVHGLRLGADDYVAKPVDFQELVARIETVLRRRRALAPILFGDLELDLARRRALRTGRRVELTPKEFDLLLALVRAEGSVLSRRALLREVWDIDFDPGTALLDVHLGRLRKKLDRFGRPLIQTVKGEGYRAVRRESESAR